ncbi:MAG: lipoate--protein ligase family protein [Anaerolineales bacterium]|nr:lipoate--protein ligase family protein [Anaerolineales bacterium]
MAVDEAILEAAGGGQVLPTLRMYAWEPPCLSLGYAQPYSDVDLTTLHHNGWDVVRRPTGGRAILHTDELTYAVIGPLSEPRLAGSVLESYRCLSQALLAALHLLDLPAQSQAEQENSTSKGPVCFEVPSNYEITVGGRKLIGSAQARRKEGVLQHGTLPLYGDLGRITQALVFPDELSRQVAAQRLHSRACTVQEVLGQPVTWQQAAEAFISAFQNTLNLELLPAELTPAEHERAAQLVKEKYAHPDWTERI